MTDHEDIEQAQARVTVYSKPDCVQCDATYRALDKRGINYAVVDVTQDSAGLAYVRSLGYLQAPVVVTDIPLESQGGRSHWSGFKPDAIGEYADRRRDQAPALSPARAPLAERARVLCAPAPSRSGDDPPAHHSPTRQMV